MQKSVNFHYFIENRTHFPRPSIATRVFPFLEKKSPRIRIIFSRKVSRKREKKLSPNCDTGNVFVGGVKNSKNTASWGSIELLPNNSTLPISTENDESLIGAWKSCCTR